MARFDRNPWHGHTEIATYKMNLAQLVKTKRKAVGLTQEEFAERTGVALTVIRKIEQGKTNLNMEKVNLVLRMFGHQLIAAPIIKNDDK